MDTALSARAPKALDIRLTTHTGMPTGTPGPRRAWYIRSAA